MLPQGFSHHPRLEILHAPPEGQFRRGHHLGMQAADLGDYAERLISRSPAVQALASQTPGQHPWPRKLGRRLSHLISRSDAHKHIVWRAGIPQLLIFVATSSVGLVAPMYVRGYILVWFPMTCGAWTTWASSLWRRTDMVRPPRASPILPSGPAT